MYKDTIRKQERVISKLETLLEKTLKDTQKAREGMIELEKLRTENLELQGAMKNNQFKSYGDDSESERLRREVQQLESIIGDLRAQLQQKRPPSQGMGKGNDNWEDQKIELEVKLQRSTARVDALQNELNNCASTYAKEISKLKLIIAEKESLIDTMSGDIYGGVKR